MTTATGPDTESELLRLGPVRRYARAHPRVVDLAVAAVFAGVAVLATFDPSQAVGVVPASVVAIVGSGLLIARRWRPVLVAGGLSLLAAATIAATGQLNGVDLGLAFALYTVASMLPARVAWATAAATVSLAAAAVWWWEEPTPDPSGSVDTATVLVDDRWASSLGLLVLALTGMAIGVSVRSRRLHVAELVARADAASRELESRAQLARAAERGRIAREMHDIVAHSVSVMITLADGATAALDRDPDRSREALAELSRTGRVALRDLRGVLGALAEDDTPWEPPVEGSGLQDLVERFRTAGLPVRARGLDLELPADTGMRLAIYRATQEALTNVLRHAPGADRVEVTLTHGSGGWIVEVGDSGSRSPGAEPSGAGMGLIGMRERVALVGGTVAAGPDGPGWRVRVELPEEATR